MPSRRRGCWPSRSSCTCPSGCLAKFTNVINQFIYFPDSIIFQDPGDFGLEFEDVYLTTSDGVRIHGWFVPGSGGTTLLWFHGNGGNISNRTDNIAGLNRRLGVSILIIDYRGYGLSEGSPDEQGTYLDAEAAVAHALSQAGRRHRACGAVRPLPWLRGRG